MKVKVVFVALTAVFVSFGVEAQHMQRPPLKSPGGGLGPPPRIDIPDNRTRTEKLPDEVKPERDHSVHPHKQVPHIHQPHRSPPPQEERQHRESAIKVMEWPFANAQYPFHIQLRVFTNGWQVSPEVTLVDRNERVLTFRCVRDQVLCYGAWDKQFKSWGAGSEGDKYCSDCCKYCTEGRVPATRF